MVSPSYHELDSFRGCKFLPPISDGSRTSELSPLTEFLGLVTAEGESIPAAPFFEMLTRVVVRCFRLPLNHLLFCLLRFYKVLVISRSEKYLLWNARTSWSKRVRSFLIRLFSFLTDPFIVARTVHFMTPLLISQTHFCCFYNTCLI